MLALGVLLIGLALACTGCVKPVVTRAQFDSVTNGMPYAEVEKIIGTPGRQGVATTIPAVPGVSKAVTGATYTWINLDGSNMTATFVDDKLIDKREMRLK